MGYGDLKPIIELLVLNIQIIVIYTAKFLLVAIGTTLVVYVFIRIHSILVIQNIKRKVNYAMVVRLIYDIIISKL